MARRTARTGGRRTDTRDARREQHWQRRLMSANSDPREAAEAQFAKTRAAINRIPKGDLRTQQWRRLEATLASFNTQLSDTAAPRPGQG